MKNRRIILSLILVFATAGCRLIYDDLSVCGTDYLINYEMRLVTEVQTTIEERLTSDIEKSIADTLKKWSEPYFSGHAHDLDMSFYSLDGTGVLLHHKNEIIDAKSKSYTLYIPRQNYYHLAVVNILDNADVTLVGGDYASSMRISQRHADTLQSHNTAIYTARMAMYMDNLTDSNLTFNVHLYMASSATALVLTNGNAQKAKLKEVLLSGTASDFNVNDSVYSFEYNSIIRAEKVSDYCYATMSLPSRDSLPVASAVAPHAKRADNSLWQMKVYMELPDGKVTETVLSFPYPLRAATLEIVKVQVQDDGSVVVIGDNEVGVTVTLDWKPGNEYELITG